MRLSRISLIVAAVAVALVGCNRSDKAFDDRVHAYLLSHPEVIQEAIGKLQEKQQAQAANQAKAAIEKNRAALERDPHDFVANPNGKITVTEFYDYRCPHCVNAAPAVLSIIQQSPDIRFVFKELPIFGAPSERAAAGAIAAMRGHKDYLAVYHDFMATRPLDDAAVDRILTAHGVDPATLTQADFLKDARAQLAATHDLAATLGVDGTPAFIVGDTNIPGEDMDSLRAAIAAQRAHKG